MTGEKGEFYGEMQQDSNVIEETMTFDMFMVGKTHCCFKNKIWGKQQYTVLGALLGNSNANNTSPLHLSCYCLINYIPAYCISEM